MLSVKFKISDEAGKKLHLLRRRMEAKDVGDVIGSALAILDMLSELSDAGFTEVVAINPDTNEAKPIDFKGRV